jgi:hypothetical protein
MDFQSEGQSIGEAPSVYHSDSRYWSQSVGLCPTESWCISNSCGQSQAISPIESWLSDFPEDTITQGKE